MTRDPAHPQGLQALGLRTVLFVAIVAIAARGAACWKFSANLSDDRDAYLGLAEGIREGRGFSTPGSTTPTAYRPPLYPLVLAPISRPGEAGYRAALHCLLGGLMSAAVVWLAATSGLTPLRQLIAGLIAAIDPLLVYYSTLPMTETLAATLSAGLLATAAAACKSSLPRVQRNLSLAAAVLFSLAVLCRPTYWAFTVCVVVFGAWQAWRGQLPPGFREMRSRRADWILATVVSLVVLLPWPIRNWIVLGRPIVTTTHGGYTLLLGNNPAYYREVVDQPWGVVWDGSQGGGQEEWVRGLDAEMTAAKVAGEIHRDRWMKSKAYEAIGAEPGTFLKACFRRFVSFWGVRPHADSGFRISGPTVMVVAAYYSLLWLAVLWGLWNGLRRHGCATELASLMLAAFLLVHLVYWTDARMRAPVVPVIALFAAWAGHQRRVADAASTGAS